MGGIIATAVSVAIPLIIALFETAAEAAVLYLGSEGLLTIAGIGLNALVDYSVPLAVSAVIGAYSTYAASIAGATFGGALILGAAIGITTGIALYANPGIQETLYGYIKSQEKPLTEKLTKPLLDYINGGGSTGGQGRMYSGTESNGAMWLQRGQEDGFRSMLSYASNGRVSRKGQQNVRTKRKAAPSGQVVQSSKSMRKKSRR